MLSRTVPTEAWLDIKGHRMTEPSTGWQLEDITYSGGTRAGPRANGQVRRAVHPTDHYRGSAVPGRTWS